MRRPAPPDRVHRHAGRSAVFLHNSRNVVIDGNVLVKPGRGQARAVGVTGCKAGTISISGNRGF